MTKTLYSISAASRIAGKGRATIARHCKAGKVSFVLDADGNKRIDASELVRVYGNDCNFEQEEKRGGGSDSLRSASKSPAPPSALDEVRAQQLRQYESQIEHLQQALDKAQESQNRITLLLEQRSSEKGDWQSSLDAMAKLLGNQTEQQISQLRDNHDKEIHQIKQAIVKERNKTIWQRLWQ